MHISIYMHMLYEKVCKKLPVIELQKYYSHFLSPKSKKLTTAENVPLTFS